MPNRDDYNHFATNPVNIDIGRSAFNLDHSVKFSCNVGDVIPFDVIEVLPGDTFEIDTSKVIRLQPLVAPMMDEVILDTYWFFVPNRLVWRHWKEFMGENVGSAWSPSIEYNIPTLSAPKVNDTGDYYWNVGTIADYMGLPVEKNVGSRTFSALPFRAYALICDQWFRSEAIMTPVHCFVDDSNRVGSNGDSQVFDIELGGKPFVACKYFDYFTSCLPSPQRGDAVLLNIIRDNSALLPVVTGMPSVSHPYQVGKTSDDVPVSFSFKTINSGVSSEFRNIGVNRSLMVNSNNNFVLDTDTTPNYHDSYVYFNNLFAQLDNNSFNSISINDLRSAFAVQKYLEKQARFGGRYIEFIKGFFGVDSPDARLQRTEYLGGSRLPLNINQVEQTSATQDGTTPLGDVAGMSVTGDSNSDFTKSFTEHGHIIGCAVVRYHHSYQDGIHKLWKRKTPYEFYNPVFANLGEMPVYTYELYGYSPTPTDGVFGYNEAWAEYRTLPSKICGELRSVYSTPLDMWHLGDHYNSIPFLDSSWLREDKSNLDRCLAVTSDVSNQVICDFFIKTKAVRPMPVYSIPGLIDHH